MKLVFMSILVCASFSAFAGGVDIECTNAGNSIEIHHVPDRKVLIANTDFNGTLNFTRYEYDDLYIDQHVLQKLPSEKLGSSTRSVSLVEIILSRRDGGRMINTYNRLAEPDGSLRDYFLCVTTTHSAPIFSF